MDFFAHQERARKLSLWLVVLYAIALIAVVAAVDLLITITYRFTNGEMLPPMAHLWIALMVLALMLFVSGFRMADLRAEGGHAVAQMAGARPVRGDTRNFHERRLLNVVEEMAIASGLRVPDVYVLRGDTINAFAAGYNVNEAVVAVTEGALRLLKRSELQGVIGHEFSHILHGDMRLNMRLLGMLAGIQFLGSAGAFIMQNASRGSARSRDSAGATLGALGFGLMLWLIGLVGAFASRTIQAAVSRQREYLADASSVQFTRDAGGIGGALQKIGSYQLGSKLDGRYAQELSHLFFADGLERLAGAMLATHPPVEERLRRLGQPSLPPREAFRTQGLSQQQIVQGFSALVAQEITVEQQRVAHQLPPLELNTERVVNEIGETNAQHVDTAQGVLAHIDAQVLQLIATRAGAEALLYALVLAQDTPSRHAQLELLHDEQLQATAQQVSLLRAELDRLGDIARLPLMDLALPQLRGDASARENMVQQVTRMIELDQRVSLHEFVFHTLIERDLIGRFERAQPVTYKHAVELAAEIILVASLIMHSVRRTGYATADAFAPAREISSWLERPVAADQIDLAAVRAALRKLRLLAPLQKPSVIRALVAVANADQQITVRELELLRAIGSAIDCPIPTLVPVVSNSQTIPANTPTRV